MRTYSRKNSSYLKKAFIASNFNEMCRLCLSEMDLGLTPIIQDSPNVCYQEWIQYGVNVQVEEGDGLPPNICEDCLALVEQTYLFKKKCKASDSKLREHLELIELNDEHRLHEMGFSDLEEDSNLFRRNEATQSNCDESSAIDSGGTVQNMEINENEIDIDNDRMLEDEDNEDNENAEDKDEDNEDDDDEDEDECTFKDVTYIPKEKKQDENIHVINGKRTKDTEQQTEIIPKPIEKRKSNEVKNKGRQGKIKRFILRGEKRVTDDDDEEEDLSVCEVVPVDRSDESADGPESPDENDAEENAHSCSKSQAGKSVTTLQEIYDQWECDDSQQGDGFADTNINTVTSTNTNDVVEGEEQAVLLHIEVQNVTFENGTEPVQVNRIYQSKNEIEIIETLPTTALYSCCTCPDTFVTPAELKEHLTSAHEISEASSCEVCYKTFTCTNSLRRHMLVHTGFKPFKCRICSRSFSQTSTLKRHILTHEESKPFVCDYCNKSYTQKVNLISHMKIHGVISDDIVFNCKTCNKSFFHQSGLSRHRKEHKGYRFMCTHCKKSFVDSSALLRHVKRLHQRRSQRRTILHLRTRSQR